MLKDVLELMQLSKLGLRHVFPFLRWLAWLVRVAQMVVGMLAPCIFGFALVLVSDCFSLCLHSQLVAMIDEQPLDGVSMLLHRPVSQDVRYRKGHVGELPRDRRIVAAVTGGDK